MNESYENKYLNLKNATILSVTFFLIYIPSDVT